MASVYPASLWELASLTVPSVPHTGLLFVPNLSNFCPPLGLTFLYVEHSLPCSLCSQTCSSSSPRLNASTFGGSCSSPLHSFTDPAFSLWYLLSLNLFNFLDNHDLLLKTLFSACISVYSRTKSHPVLHVQR